MEELYLATDSCHHLHCWLKYLSGLNCSLAFVHIPLLVILDFSDPSICITLNCRIYSLTNFLSVSIILVNNWTHIVCLYRIRVVCSSTIAWKHSALPPTNVSSVVWSWSLFWEAAVSAVAVTLVLGNQISLAGQWAATWPKHWHFLQVGSVHSYLTSMFTLSLLQFQD